MLFRSLARLFHSEGVTVIVIVPAPLTQSTTKQQIVPSSSDIRTAIAVSSGNVIMDLRAAVEDLITNEGGKEQRAHFEYSSSLSCCLEIMCSNNTLKSLSIFYPHALSECSFLLFKPHIRPEQEKLWSSVWRRYCLTGRSPSSEGGRRFPQWKH